MATTKGKIVREYAVTVEHKDARVLVSWDGKVQYSTVQDGWTSEASAIREAATFLLDTEGCWVEVQPAPLHHNGTGWTKGAGHYVMRLRVKNWD
jgi:hypothetical protein